MYTFSELRQELNGLLIKYSGKQELLFLNALKQEVNSQEIYYNNIPHNIKTTSTLHYIMQKLKFKLDQFLFYKLHPLIIPDINIEYINNFCENIYGIASDTATAVVVDKIIPGVDSEKDKMENIIKLLEEKIIKLEEDISKLKVVNGKIRIIVDKMETIINKQN